MSVITLPNLDDFTRKRLNSNKLTYREFAKRTAELVHGNETLGKLPLNWDEIAEEFQVNRKLVYVFRDLALNLHYLECIHGIYKKPELAKKEYLSSLDMQEL